MRAYLLLWFLSGCVSLLNGQQHKNWYLETGLRLNKAIGLYHENGISLKAGRASSRWTYSFHYYTSRTGTAYNSNAIPQDNFLLQADYRLMRTKNRLFQIDAGVHTGYFRADYGAAIFDVLDNSSPLLGIELSPRFAFGSIILETGFGYQLLHGKGTSGPGTLYPFYVQTTLSYRFNP
jgi:hypothetical protein